MKEYVFRKRLNAGDQLIGTIITLSDPAAAEIMAQAGFDWLWFDAEHSPLNVAQIQIMAQAAGDCPCLVRVPAADDAWVKKTLDAGVDGIIFPLINTPEQAARAVGLSKYPPVGQRPVGLGRAQGYGRQFESYVNTANEWITTIIQIEHLDAVRNLSAILAVPGVDAVIIGPYDLSASMGKPGLIDDPDVVNAIQHVKALCQSAGKPVGIFSTSIERGRQALVDGYNFVAVGVDSMLLSEAAADILHKCRTLR